MTDKKFELRDVEIKIVHNGKKFGCLAKIKNYSAVAYSVKLKSAAPI